MHQCALCNENIDDVQLQFGDALEIEGEYWHADCHAEYFDEVLETA